VYFIHSNDVLCHHITARVNSDFRMKIKVSKYEYIRSRASVPAELLPVRTYEIHSTLKNNTSPFLFSYRWIVQFYTIQWQLKRNGGSINCFSESSVLGRTIMEWCASIVQVWFEWRCSFNLLFLIDKDGPGSTAWIENMTRRVTEARRVEWTTVNLKWRVVW
jgi:hypothetical protein